MHDLKDFTLSGMAGFGQEPSNGSHSIDGSPRLPEMTVVGNALDPIGFLQVEAPVETSPRLEPSGPTGSARVAALQEIFGPEVVLLPIPHGQKGPKCRGWVTTSIEDMRDSDHLEKLGTGNIGVLLGSRGGGLCSIDIDADEDVEPFLELNPRLRESTRTRGRRGGNIWVRIIGDVPPLAKVKKLAGGDWGEWRSDGGQTVVMGVHPEGMSYRFTVECPPVELRFDEIIWPSDTRRNGPSKKRRVLGASSSASSQSRTERPASLAVSAVPMGAVLPEDLHQKVLAHLRGFRPAISGSGGHNTTFAFACDLLKGFNLSDEQACPYLEQFNREKCEPHWSSTELVHKLSEARRVEDRCPPGYLLSGALRDGFILLPGSKGVGFRDTAQALYSRAARKRDLLSRGGVPCELRKDGQASKLYPLNVSEARSRFEKYGPFAEARSKKGGEDFCLRPVYQIPRDIVDGLLHAEEIRLLPQVSGLINCPVAVEESGQLRFLDQGFDPATGLLITGGVAPPEVPYPEAVEALKEILADFEFVSPGDHARALASFITPAMKMGGHIRGFVPVDFAEANESQAGKGTRHQLIVAIYNETLGIVAQRKGGVGSMEETFNSHLVSGRAFIQFDNMRGTLDSPQLESFLTCEGSFAARVPYRGQIEIDPKGHFLFVTSNGMDNQRDFTNRCSIIRIRKRPDGYQFRNYPEGNVIDHVRGNQPWYLGCVFAVIREWIRCGKRRSCEARHSFRDWAQTMDAICQEILGVSSMFDGHADLQRRASNPALNFVRQLCSAVETHGQLDVDLQAVDLRELANLNTIEIHGASAEDSRGQAMVVGKLMQNAFGGDATELRLDDYIVQRATRAADRGNTEGGAWERKVYRFTRVMGPGCSQSGAVVAAD